MKAIMTVTAHDRVGIIAGVCSLLAEMGVNILDLNQTVMEGIFTMTLLVDTSTSTHSFDDIRSALIARGEEESLNIHIQRADIFEAMHRV
ncbi:MAG: ACT domain-containing protein [Synergistaceae bacterium]|nr:ACT domain-containing protein [Synergistaceae bacterium]